MDWMLLPLKRYADFKGRSRRMEFWMYNLGVVGASLVLALIGGVLARLSGSSMLSGTGLLLFGLFWIALIIPSIAVQVRRFHDQGKAGYFVFIGLIPYVGGLIVLVLMCLPGTKGPNKYGPDPLASGEVLGEVFN